MKVMLIDDDSASLESLGYCLEIEGHETDSYVDPRRALDSYRPGEYDVVVTDINMPQIDGVEVLKRIRELDPGAFVVMLTGYADVENSVAALNGGAFTFLRKPLDIRELLVSMRRIETKLHDRRLALRESELYREAAEEMDLTYRELQSHVVAVDQVQSVVRKIHESIGLEEIMDELAANTANLIGCERSLIVVRGEGRDLCRGYCIGEQREVIRCGECSDCLSSYPFADWLAHTTVRIDNEPGEDMLPLLSRFHPEPANVIVLPLVREGRTLGMIAGFNKPGGFHGNDKFMLNMIGAVALTAIYNNGLVGQLEGLFEQTIESLVKTIDAKDSYTRGHTGRVSDFSLAIGERLGWGEEKLKQTYIGTLFHDIGKIGIPDQVLNKRGKLTDEEFELMKSHVTIGYEILKDIPQLEGVLDYVLCHHERWDGRGYPRGLAGEDIPVEGRIVCVADSFDAMISDRGYREALPVEKAVDELRRCAGAQFDPRIVKLFIELLDEGRLTGIGPGTAEDGARTGGEQPVTETPAERRQR